MYIKKGVGNQIPQAAKLISIVQKRGLGSPCLVLRDITLQLQFWA